MKTEQFKCYLAGVIDSDGSISVIRKHIKRSNPYYGISIQITWTNKKETQTVFKKLVKIYGGTFHECKLSTGNFKNSKPAIKYGIYGNGRPKSKLLKKRQMKYYIKNKELNSKNGFNYEKHDSI